MDVQQFNNCSQLNIANSKDNNLLYLSQNQDLQYNEANANDLPIFYKNLKIEKNRLNYNCS